MLPADPRTKKTRLRTRLRAWIVAAASGCAGWAHAMAILAPTYAYLGSPDEALVQAQRLREYRTEASLTALPTLHDQEASFTHRVAWMSAHRVLPGLPFVPLIWSRTMGYELSFTVDDPLGAGYSLDIDSLISGYATARWDGNDGPFSAFVQAAGGVSGAMFDDGSGFEPITTMSAYEAANVSPGDPFGNVRVAGRGSYHAGRYVGTRTFTLRVGSLEADNVATLGNRNVGEAALRFGLDPTLDGFDVARYPGVDAESAVDHGHFVTVRALFGDPPPPPQQVPLPGTLALLGVAMLAGGSAARRSSRAGPRGGGMR